MNAPTPPSRSSGTDSGTDSGTATRWTIDPGHSAVGFSVRHLMITTVRGEFEKYSGEVSYDPAHPETIHITASVDVASINTRQAKRDEDLRGELFFDAGKHPAFTFVSKSARSAGPGALDVTGDLTIRGTTREVTLSVRDISAVQVDMRGTPRMGASASTQIKRADFGISWNKTLETGGVVVADLVTLALELSLTKAA